jgi:hypothetical protein
MKNFGGVIIILIFSLVPANTHPFPTPSGQEGVKYQGGRLSVDLEGALAEEVFQIITAQTGVKFILPPDMLTRRLEGRFRDMDLEQGIKRLLHLLLSQNNYIFFHRLHPDTGKMVLEKVEVLYHGDVITGKGEVSVIQIQDESGIYQAPGSIRKDIDYLPPLPIYSTPPDISWRYAPPE